MKEREAYWDAVKALLIMLVIAGHSIQFIQGGDIWDNLVFKGIYMFHMPLFVMVSGYFGITGIERRGWRSFLRQARRLLPPVIILYMLRLATNVWILHTPVSKASQLGDGALWFLVVLMECSLFANMMFSLHNKLWRGLWLAIPLGIGILAEGIMPYASYFTTLWPCFLMGAYMRKLHFQRTSINAKWLITMPLFAGALLCYKNEWYMYLAPLHLDVESARAWLTRLVCAVIGSACFLCAVHLFKMEKSRHLCKMGSCTLAIYVLQALFFKCTSMFYPIHCTNTAVALLISLVITSGLYLAYRITHRSKLIASLLYGE